MEKTEALQMLVDLLYWLKSEGDHIMAELDYQPDYHEAARDFLEYAQPRGIVSLIDESN